MSNHASMWSRIKQRIARRAWTFLRYWAIDVDRNDMHIVIEAERRRGVRIGQRVVIYESVLDKVHPEFITIGDDVTITHAMILTHDDSAVLWLRRRRVAPVTIGNRVFIGARSVVLPGVQIGDDCIIGAGAIVTRDVPPGSVVAGNPARVLKSISQFKAELVNEPSLMCDLVNGNLVTHAENRLIGERARKMYFSAAGSK